MKDLFVTYKVAKLLKKKGFNESCLGYYFGDKLKYPSELATTESQDKCQYITTGILAPTLEQAINWLMDNHNIFILPHITFDDKNGHWYYYSIKYRKNSDFTEGSFNRNQALETAILEALNLIK